MRDLRDPQKLGDMLRRAACRYRELGVFDADTPLSAIADYAAGTLNDHVPDVVDPDPVARYPRLYDLTVETRYRRTPIERLAG